MSLMEMFSNPATIDQLSFGDKMAGAGITTLMGMGITFIILLLLWGCIAIMAKFVGIGSNKPKPQPVAAAPAPVATPASAPTVATDNSELVAVITAAIAALEGEAVASNLIVRKINRLSGEMPAWASAGHNDCVESRKR